MFKRQVNYEKLRLNLEVCIQRFNLLLKRKKIRALKKRRKISGYVRIGQKKKARICVEQIIPIDCLIEVGDILNNFCRLLIEKFCALQNSDFLEGNLIEAIYCIIWGAPHLQHEVNELQIVSYLLTSKYGKLCTAFKYKNVVFKKLNWKLTLARSGQWLSPKTIEFYLLQLITYYNNADSCDSVKEQEPKSSSVGVARNSGLRKVSQYPMLPNVEKAGYRRSSVGNFANERPWTTLGTRTKASQRNTIIGEVDISRNEIQEVRRKLFRSNSTRSTLTMNTLESRPHSLTSSLCSINSEILISAEEYVSLLDNMFNFEIAASKDITSKKSIPTENRKLDISQLRALNWGNFAF